MGHERFGSFGLATPPARKAISADEAIALLKRGEAKAGSLQSQLDFLQAAAELDDAIGRTPR